MIIYKLYNDGRHYDACYDKGKSNYFLQLEDAVAQFKKTHPNKKIVKEEWNKTKDKYRIYTELTCGELFYYETVLKLQVNQ